MAIAVGVNVVASYSGADSTTTGAVTTQASGSTLVLAAHWQNGSAAPTISDSKSNSYTAIGSVRQTSTTFDSWCQLFYIENATGGSSHTFTAAKTGGYASVHMVEITGGETSGILDQNTGASLDTASPVTSGSTGTTSQAAELLVGFVGVYTGADPVFTPNNSFTTLNSLTSSSNDWCGSLSYLIVASTGTYETSVGVTNLLQAAGLIATFKEAAGGASGQPIIKRLGGIAHMPRTIRRGFY